MTPDELALLAAGPGTSAVLDALKRGQFGKHALLLRAIMEVAERDFPGEYAEAGYERGYDLLASLQAVDPQRVVTVLTHPQVGSWAHACLRLLQRPSADRDQVRATLGQIGCVAAAAATGAGVEFEVTVPTQRRAVLLPTLGQAVFDSDGTAVIRNDDQGLTITAGGVVAAPPADHREDAPHWLGLRRITAESAGVRLEVDLDDLGPHRACGGGRRVADRLDRESFLRWRDQVREAWSLLVEVHPDGAASVAQVLTSIVPQAEGYSESITSRDAYGAVQLTEPDHSAYLAETLVHESQHSKLNAVLDLRPLYEDGGGLYYSPPRDDPRPLHGLLHATYAFFGISGFWRRYRLVRDQHRDYAHFQFAGARAQVLSSTESLLDSGSLTAEGAGFVTAMRATARKWATEQVPERPKAWAEAAALDHRLVWRLNNLRHDPGEVAVLTKAYAAGDSAPADTGIPRPALAASAWAVMPHPRIRLRYLQLLSPDSFERICAGLEPVPGTSADLDEADVAYLRDDPATAARLHAERLMAGSDDPACWAGLALALREQHGDAGLLDAEPQLVRAVCNAVGDLDGHRPDPRALARWLRGTMAARDGER